MGVDLAKESFKASLNGSVRSFKNEEEGIQEMIKWARRKSKTEQLLIAFEATGSVSRPFTMKLIRRGMEWVCLFPPAVRAFARSVGKQVKSDKQDARIIEEYARNLRTLGRLHTNPYVTERILDLQEIESTVNMVNIKRLFHALVFFILQLLKVGSGAADGGTVPFCLPG